MNKKVITYLPVASIECPTQVRTQFGAESEQSLATSILALGLQLPVRVQPLPGIERYGMLDGERCLRAVKALGWDSIPAIIEDPLADPADVVVQALVANCQRESLSPIELAQALQGLIRDGKLTAAEAAQRTSLSPATVSRTLALLALPENVKRKVHEGAVAASTAYSAVKIRDPKARAHYLARALRGDLTRDEVSAASSTAKRTRRHSKPSKLELLLEGGARLLVAGPTLTCSEFCSQVRALLAKLEGSGGPTTLLQEAATRMGESAGVHPAAKGGA